VKSNRDPILISGLRYRTLDSVGGSDSEQHVATWQLSGAFDRVLILVVDVALGVGHPHDAA
jgi:hypothetical protein